MTVWEITPLEFYRIERGGWRVWLNWGVQPTAPTPNHDGPLDRLWCWTVNLPDRKGERCRIVARGKMNSCQIEFADGARHIVSRFAVRKVAT